jgi:hypothetical protein
VLLEPASVHHQLCVVCMSQHQFLFLLTNQLLCKFEPCAYFLVRVMTKRCKWEAVLGELPIEVKDAIIGDDYQSAEVFKQCFLPEDGDKYSRIDMYGKGLLVKRKVLQNVEEDSVDFHPVLGRLRKLLDVAKQVVDEANKQSQALAEAASQAGPS